jgi:hypothetical protein
VIYVPLMFPVGCLVDKCVMGKLEVHISTVTREIWSWARSRSVMLVVEYRKLADWINPRVNLFFYSTHLHSMWLVYLHSSHLLCE